jgi:uncharacterized protein YfaS (alpha-2-macroglobulin family)
MRNSALLAGVFCALLFGAQTASADEQIYFYGSLYSSVVTPGHTIVASYNTNAPTSEAVDVVVYAVPVERAATLQARSSAEPGDVVAAASAVVARVIAGVADPKEPQQRTALLPALPIGYYFAVATLGSHHVVSMFDVTTLGIVQNAMAGTTSFFAVDLRTYERHMGPTTIAVPEASGVRTLSFDTSSLALDTRPLAPQARDAIARSADGSAMIVNLERDYRTPGQDVGFVQTDRPVYRPGQTIDLRAIVRKGRIGAYALPSGMRSVTVTSPNGTSIYRHDLKLDGFGTLHAQVRLPQDAEVGYYRIAVGTLQSGVTVAAYKKPEYEITLTAGQKYVVGGDTASFALSAQYFFGRPVGGMQLHYTIWSQPQFVPYGGPYGFIDTIRRFPQRKKLAEGTFATGSDGNATFSTPTDKTATEEHLTVDVDGRDASGRTVSVATTLRVVPALFSIALAPTQWFAQQGQVDDIAVATVGYDEKPRPGVAVTVTIARTRWDEKSEKTVVVSTTTQTVTSDANGKAVLSWKPADAGAYRFTATAQDERGNTATGNLYLWAIGAGDDSWMAPIEQPEVIAQNDTIAQGKRARVLITLPAVGRDALVLVSTDRLVSVRALHVTGRTAALNIDAPPDASKFYVTVELPNENGVSTAQAPITVQPAPAGLTVTLTPQKERYEPGDRATFTVRARDAQGAPVRAQFGIGVVDEAIYAVQQASTETPLDALYGDVSSVYPAYSWFRPNREMKLSTVHSGLVRQGIVNDTYARVPAPSGAPALRTNFQDTAYWNPAVVTDAKGDATISFTWPDNLTTWRATGVAVTKATQVGQGVGSALVTKDFLVRLETPRFLRAGDRSTIIGIAQGQAAHPDVTLTLDAVPLSGFPQSASVTLDANQSASASWPVTAPGIGAALFTLRGSDGTLSDGTQMRVPLLAGTSPEHVRDAGSLPSQSSFTVSVPGGYEPGDVHVTLTPSIVAQLVQNVRLLQIYPYECTEQVLSTSLPAVFVGNVLKRAGIAQPADIDTSQIVANALARLAQLQHPDGSWGWWEYDSAHPFMTAYAMYGLAEFRKNGYAVPEGMYDRGVDSLVAQLATSNDDTLRFWGGAQPNSEWNTRAFMLFALAQAAPQRVDRKLLAQTHAHLSQLNPYALAVLGLADHALGDDANAKLVLMQLDARATNDGAWTYWHGETWHYAWEDDPIETTAYALRLETALAPTSPAIPRIVAFLRAQQRGNWWYTTKDTAAAIYAIADALHPDAAEFHPNEVVRVTLDGKALQTVHVNSAILDAADASIVIPAGSLHDGSVIAFDRSGSGALYWSSDAVRYVPTDVGQTRDAGQSILSRLFASPPNLQITRTYDAGHPGPWRVGDQITVHLSVLAHSNVQYVLVEDPYPAGAEHQDIQGHAADALWNGVQLLDDHAAFFVDRLYDGRPLDLTYTLRVTTPGTYTAPAPMAAAMYGPPVTNVGRRDTITVVP